MDSQAEALPRPSSTITSPKTEDPQTVCQNTAFVCPYCGECTMEEFFSDEGCPKHSEASAKKNNILFPYLDVSGLNESERNDLEYKLITETKDIKADFSEFLINMIKLLVELCVSLDIVKISVLSLEAFFDDIGATGLIITV